MLRVGLEGVITHFLKFINGAQHGTNTRFVEPERFEIIKPQIAVTEAHVKILLGQTEAAQALSQKGDQLDLRLRTRLAENIGVKLEEAPPTAFLHALIAVKFGDAVPLDRAFEGARFGAHESAHGRSHLGTKRDFAPTLVGETEKLAFDFVAGLSFIKVERLEHGSVVFGKPVSAGGLTPEAEDVISAGKILGIELAETGQGLERGHETGKVAPRTRHPPTKKKTRTSRNRAGSK